MTASSSPQFCPFCGAARGEGWAFCQFCGEPLPGSTDAVPSPVVDRPEAALWREANRLLEEGAYDLAEDRLHSLREKTGESPEALALLGIVGLRCYRLDEARELLDRASALAPTSSFVRLKRAEYWLALGLLPKAQDELSLALMAATGEPALRAHIRSLMKNLQRDGSRSFVRATALPSPAPIIHILKALLRRVAAHGRSTSTEPTVAGEKGETAWLR
jgi:tetratricopeptide (TPR) repeat protein